MTPTREQVREQLVAECEAAWIHLKAQYIYSSARVDAEFAYMDACHALNRHDAPSLVALIEPLPSQQPEPTQDAPMGVEETEYPHHRADQ